MLCPPPPTLPSLLICLNYKVCIHSSTIPDISCHQVCRSQETVEPPVASVIRSRQCKFSRMCDIFPSPPPPFFQFSPSQNTPPFPSSFSLHSFKPRPGRCCCGSCQANTGSCVLRRQAAKGALGPQQPSWLMGRGKHLAASGQGNAHGRVFDSADVGVPCASLPTGQEGLGAGG